MFRARLPSPWRSPAIVAIKPSPARLLASTAPASAKALPPRRKISDDEITESFLKGSGPGGQKINKTSSAVQLKHLATGIVVKSQETRSREQNRKLARQLLGEKLDAMEKGAESRVAIKAARVRAKKASASKKTRRKYRKLDAGKEGQEGREVQGSGGNGEGSADAVTERMARTLDDGPDPTVPESREGRGRDVE